jgi:hypothetical protein
VGGFTSTLTIQNNIGAPFERTPIDVPGPFPQRPSKLIPPDHYELFYQVARSLRHSQSRGFDSGGSADYQLLLPLRSTVGAT